MPDKPIDVLMCGSSGFGKTMSISEPLLLEIFDTSLTTGNEEVIKFSAYLYGGKDCLKDVYCIREVDYEE